MESIQQPSTNPFVDLPSRPMRVKVLYTFDNDNKTNCLARFPDVLNVHAIPIDDSTHIGVIELRTCIQAIVAASPELVSRLTQADFTIYAYDYSEYETPLVGQGMLSSVLAALSPTPNAPAYQSKTMITGRICKNVMGIFSNGVQETLEVKLRLVPVPRPVQQDYVKSIEALRSLQPVMSSGIDFHAWSDAINAASPVPTPAPEELDDMPELSCPNRPTNSYMDQRRMSDGAFPPYSTSKLSRPIGGRTTTRPSSRASGRSEYLSRPTEGLLEPSIRDHRPDDGPARKRAKVTQTEWRGKSTIGTSDDSLRVAASTAASIRIHKPVATRPSGLGNRSLEPPPRAPTPVAARNLNNGMRAHVPSFARRESTLCNMQGPGSPYDNNSDAVVSSPEGMQGLDDRSYTPVEFPSSPPAMPFPSSPGLPALPKAADSGYMSGSAYESLADNENRPIDEDDVQFVQQYEPGQAAPRSEISFIEQTPGPPELLPTRMQPSKLNVSQQKAQNSAASHHLRRSSLALSARPPNIQSSSTESMPCQSKSRMSEVPMAVQQTIPFAKASNTNGHCSSRAASPVTGERFAKLPRSGSGAKRKKVIQEKLIQSVASGEMPMFCTNCGAIETPTWRSLHVKTINGSPDDLDTTDKENDSLGIEIIERDIANDKVIKYRIIKNMRKSKDVQMQGYEAMHVCNPCGLWFNKFKRMRPAHKWNASKRKSKQQNNESLQSDMIEPALDFLLGTCLDQVIEEVADKGLAEQSTKAGQSELTEANSQRSRANSLQPQSKKATTRDEWTGKDLNAALARAIRSSPVRVPGSQHSPIELEEDLTPQPTRRLLFPSPRKDAQSLSLDEAALTAPGASITSDNPLSITKSNTLGLESSCKALDKENVDPEAGGATDFAQLIQASPSLLQSVFKTPSKISSVTKRTPPSQSWAFLEGFPLTTPSPLRRDYGNSGSMSKMLMNSKATPTGTNFDSFLPTFSSAERDSLFPRTPTRQDSNAFNSPYRGGPEETMTPITKHLTQLLSRSDTANSSDFVLDMNSATGTAGLDLCLAGFSSPGKAFDFGDLPNFLTPRKTDDVENGGDGSQTRSVVGGDDTFGGVLDGFQLEGMGP